MPLEPIVSDIESVDETVRSFYVEKEGQYVLDVAAKDGWALENVDGLRSSLSKERKMAKDFEKKVRDYEARFDGIDPDGYKEALAKLEELSSFDPEQEADKKAEEKYKNQKTKLENQLNKAWQQKWDTEVEPLRNKYSQLENQLREQLVARDALQAIVAEGGDPDLLMPHVVSKVKFEMDDNGKFSTYLEDSNGPLYNNKGEPMSSKEFVASVLKEKFPAAFKSSAKPGGGMQESKPIMGKNFDPNKASPLELIMAGVNKKI